MDDKPKKGVAGKSTGGKSRKAIRTKISGGCSLSAIGRAANRSASTISQILSGSIKNPPSNLSTNIRKLKCRK